VQLAISTNGEAHTKTKLAPWRDWDNFTNHDFIIRYEIIDDIFVIDLRTFSNVPPPLLAEVVQSIEAAVANDTRKFIIDLRGNGGGSSAVGEQLLRAMGITIPQFGGIMRTNSLAVEQFGLWYLRPLNFFGIEYIRMAPSVASSSNPNNVFVSVLTDTNTFSSATWMATWVQDGGFGNIIGSPSRNAPTSFGDTVWYTLPYSGIGGSTSFWQWLRPDENANPTVLMPDILVHPGEALEVALEYLRNLDR